MQLLSRYDFANDRRFETYYLSRADTQRHNVPECDVIGLRRVTESEDEEDRMLVLRPDEALILARMLVDAVHQVSEGFTIGLNSRFKFKEYSYAITEGTQEGK